MRCIRRATALRRYRKTGGQGRVERSAFAYGQGTGPPAPPGGLPGPAVEPGDVGASCLDGVDESFLAQGRDGPPGRRPRDLVRLNQLTLGRDAGVRRILPGQDPALDDRRYLQVGRHRSERVDSL